MNYFYTLGGKTLGDAEEPSSHELRQTESFFALLLREGNYAKGIAYHILLSPMLFLFFTSTLTLGWALLYSVFGIPETLNIDSRIICVKLQIILMC